MGNGAMAERDVGMLSPINGRLSMTERLENERAHLTGRLDEIETVLSSLESNPDLADVLNNIAKLGLSL